MIAEQELSSRPLALPWLQWSSSVRSPRRIYSISQLSSPLCRLRAMTASMRVLRCSSNCLVSRGQCRVYESIGRLLEKCCEMGYCALGIDQSHCCLCASALCLLVHTNPCAQTPVLVGESQCHMKMDGLGSCVQAHGVAVVVQVQLGRHLDCRGCPSAHHFVVDLSVTAASPRWAL